MQAARLHEALRASDAEVARLKVHPPRGAPARAPRRRRGRTFTVRAVVALALMLRLCSLLRYCYTCAIICSIHATAAPSTSQTVGAPVLQANELVVPTPTEKICSFSHCSQNHFMSVHRPAPVNTSLDQQQHLSIFSPALEHDLTFTRGAGTP